MQGGCTFTGVITTFQICSNWTSEIASFRTKYIYVDLKFWFTYRIMKLPHLEHIFVEHKSWFASQCESNYIWYTTGNNIVVVCSNFAVCSKSGTRQRPFLPCAAREPHDKILTHGKQILYRAPNKNTHGENKAHDKQCRLPCAFGTRQSCRNWCRLSRPLSLPCASSRTWQISKFAVCFLCLPCA